MARCAREEFLVLSRADLAFLGMDEDSLEKRLSELMWRNLFRDHRAKRDRTILLNAIKDLLEHEHKENLLAIQWQINHEQHRYGKHAYTKEEAYKIHKNKIAD
jgi:hypothetical protein